jgi:Flp pilus assembly protein TadG
MAAAVGRLPPGARTSAGPGRRGAVLILTTLLTIMLLGLLAFAIDLGYIRIALADLQTAADAGALAGARGLTVCCTSTALSEAQRAAQLNYVFQTPVSVVPSEDIELGSWDDTTSTFTVLTGNATSNANAVRVTCRVSAGRGNALPLYFARIFGIDSQDLSAKAVAKSTPIMCGAFIGLNAVDISGGSYTDSYDSSSGPYDAASAGDKGTVCSNGDISLSGGSTVNGDVHPGLGYSLSASGGATATGTTAALTKPLTEAAVDPGDVANTNDNSSIPLSANGNDPLVSGNFHLSRGDRVTLLPGTYCFSTLVLSGNSSLEITGKTIIYVAGKVDSGSGTLTNATQIPSNLQLYAMGTSVTLSGGAQMHAVVYAPMADISFTGGNSDFFGMMVGASLTLSGGGGLHADTALTGISSSTRKGALVQ